MMSSRYSGSLTIRMVYSFIDGSYRCAVMDSRTKIGEICQVLPPAVEVHPAASPKAFDMVALAAIRIADYRNGCLDHAERSGRVILLYRRKQVVANGDKSV